VKILLDTHIILWALDDNPKLSKKARDIILDEGNEIFYSTASVWETTIKYKSKPDKIRISGNRLSEYCIGMGYKMVPIADNHVKMLDTLVYHNSVQNHNDPFDRITLSQAKAEGMKFLTHDAKISLYNEDCIVMV
jgi:PIN domain nuclease of toxin-antitoxin system